MTVQELNTEQLNELRETHFREVDEGVFTRLVDITDKVLFSHYEGISFVNDDFFCSSGE